MPAQRVTLQQRFADKIVHTSTCWLWTGKKTVDGYGQVSLIPGNWSTTILAHRLSWLIHNGDIPGDLCVLHNCPGGDNPSCVNPDHLFLGTRAENMDDMRKKGRDAPYPRAGAGNYKLSNEQAAEIRQRKARGEGSLTLAKEYGVSKRYVNALVAGRTRTEPEKPRYQAESKRPGIKREPQLRRGDGHPLAKMTAVKVIAMRARWAAGESATKLAPEFGISRQQACDILNGNAWQHV